MGIQFTKDQQKVIDLRNRNILVSAAAGSGKTAVLTERIVARLKDKADPVDIDRLLIVTFTNAAAAEMRERIRNKIMECLEEEPENEHLQKQVTLIHNAQITTIDSFCLFLIRNNFNDIGLDPGFRIADEGELRLLKQDVLEQLLEEKFAQGEEEFLHCVECYASGNHERVLEENIKKLYEFSMSYPWPEEWLGAHKNDYCAQSVEQFERSDVGRMTANICFRTVEDCVELFKQAIGICEQPDGPYMYGELLEREKEMFETLAKAETLTQLEVALEKIKFDRLPSKKDDSVSATKRELAKGLRDQAKANVKALRDKYFFQSLAKSVEQGADCARAVSQLLTLTEEYKQKLDAKKREKNVIDFSDMEHFALHILLEKKEDGSVAPTKTALDYRKYFKEIMIDEYQDSNLVQEFLLQSISGEDDGVYNRFMVGDVKQSIYKFRLARPEIFMEKYHTYRTEDGDLQRIDLHQNFRSRRQVIDSANLVFYQTMGQDLGGIDYDENAALFFGASFLPELTDTHSAMDDTELLLIERPEKEDDISVRESEAYTIAKRIKKLLKENLVTDKETGELRPVTYKDIVILLRTNSGWDEEFKKVFQEEGIPSYIMSKTGYFKTTEIQTVLQFLRVLDNPLQDIPMYGALKSVFGNFTEEDIAKIKIATEKLVKKGAFLYDRLKMTQMSDECDIEKELHAKVCQFMEKLEKYRIMIAYKPIHELLQVIFDENHYFLHVAALPGGEQRKANVEMLLEKATAFEQTSYYGLFHFIRYMEQLEKYDVDYGEAGLLEEEADVVRIMSIHKSKGLEFPICFVAGLSKKFNMQDTTQSLIADVDMGVGTDYIDPVKRLRNMTLRKNVMSAKMRLDNVAEELRILYVALTRAKEKLILTGVVDKPLEKIAALSYLASHSEVLLPYSVLAGAKSYLDFVLTAFVRHPAIRDLLEENGISIPKTCENVADTLQLSSIPLQVELVTTQGLVVEETKEQLHLAGAKEKLYRFREKVTGKSVEVDVLLEKAFLDADVYHALDTKFSFVYPYENLSELYTKTTVSELKKASMNEEEDYSFHLIEEEEVVPYIPAFMREKEEISGTTRGSAMHKIMELLDFETVQDKADVEEVIRAERASGKLTEEFANAIRIEKVAAFLQSGLSARMKAAQSVGKLYREAPFVYGVPASRLNPKFPVEETVLIQGIIDVYFEEDGELVVADYKTDVVKAEQELVDRYAVQLAYYAEALEKLTGKQVKEKIIYSFYFGKEIEVP